MLAKRLLALLLILGGLLAGCTGDQLLVPPGLGGPTSPAATGFPRQIAPGLSIVVPSFETPVVSDVASLLERLTSSGAVVEETADTSGSIFAGKGHILRINGAEVQAFEYPDEAAVRSDAAALSPDGSTFRNAKIDWVAPPHIYQRGKLLVIYNGSDPAVINPLEFVLGRQIAGAALSGTPGPVVVVPTSTPRPTPSSAPPAVNCTNKALMIADVTVPDNTNMPPGQSFLKTWRMRNTGTCTWNNGYALLFTGGTALTTTTTSPFPGTVAPGATVDLSIMLAAPAKAGTYRGNYRLRDAAGKAFGIDNSRDGLFWVQIVVNPAAAERINLAGGSSSATRQVNLTPGVPRGYVLGLAAGQRLRIQASGNVSPVVLDANAQPVDALTQTPGAWVWDVNLPADGDYMLVVRGAGRMSLTISVPAPTGIVAPPATPVARRQTVSFPPGTGSITLGFSLPAGAVQQYVLSAQAGQSMHLALSRAGTTFSVSGPDGILLAPAATGAGGRSADFTLPASGNYIISLRGQGNTLTIAIPPA